MSRIPLADAPALHSPARRTLVVRGALALVCIGAAVAAVLVSRAPHTRTIVPLPSNAQTVLVLDLSASISSDTFSQIGGTLAALARSGQRFGLVASNRPTRRCRPALPPQTCCRSSVTSRCRSSGAGFAPTFPTNPWQSTFTGGTRISSGSTSHTDRRRGRSPATVILVSDSTMTERFAPTGDRAARVPA
jgi:hypothetical protein